MIRFPYNIYIYIADAFECASERGYRRSLSHNQSHHSQVSLSVFALLLFSLILILFIFFIFLIEHTSYAPGPMGTSMADQIERESDNSSMAGSFANMKESHTFVDPQQSANGNPFTFFLSM